MVLRIFEEAEYGGGDVFECLRTLQRIRPGNNEDWYREWNNIAGSSEALAKEAEGEGFTATARRGYMRAYNYYRIAQFYLNVGDDRKVEFYKRACDCFRKAGELFSPPLEYLEVEYDKGKLEGILFRSNSEKKNGLVIYIQGLDTQKEEAYFLGIQAALERGLDVLSIEGPGQGGALFLRGMTATHDFEKPVAAFIDAVSKKQGIVSDKIAIIGRSMGGYLAPRVAAFEGRIRACVSWGAMYDLSHHLSNPRINVMAMLGAKNKAEFQEKAKLWTLKGVASKIRCPLLIVHGEADPMTPVSNAYKLYDEATCDKTLKVFKLGEPGAGHCQHDAPAITFALIFDWILRKVSA
jgi:dipeptidyl aminopeptidase/acylaminoacyl peptidase